MVIGHNNYCGNRIPVADVFTEKSGMGMNGMSGAKDSHGEAITRRSPPCVGRFIARKFWCWTRLKKPQNFQTYVFMYC